LSRIRVDGRFLIAVVLAAALLSSAVGYHSVHRDLRGVEALSNDNTLWHAAALERELSRFSRSVQSTMLGRPDLFPDAEDPGLRFDILWSRVVTAQTGSLGRRMMEIDAGGAVQTLGALLEEIEPRIADFDPSDVAANAALLRRLTAVQAQLNTLAAESDRAEQRWTEQIYRRMQGSADISKLTGFSALFLCGLIALAMRRQARLDASRLDEIRIQAERAAAAAKTRERFLTMVSHELRTPMNGVLGMLELLKGSRLDPAQAGFVRHAGRSAHVMLHVVEALLDMSDIHDAQFRLEPAEFAVADLAGAIGIRMAPLADPACGAYSIAIEGEPGRRFVGDQGRIAQLASQLVFHVVDALGAEGCRCAVGLAGGMLELSIRIDGQERLRWSLESVLRPEVADMELLASDASGPAVARELIRLMGGRAAVTGPAPGGSELRVVIPPAVMAPDPTAGPGTRSDPGPQAGTRRSRPLVLPLNRVAGAARPRDMTGEWPGGAPEQRVRVVMIDHGGCAGDPMPLGRRAANV